MWGNGIKGMSEIPAPCETKIDSDSQTMCVHVNHYGVGQVFFSDEFGFSMQISSPVCHQFFLHLYFLEMILRGWWEKSQHQIERSNKNWSENGPRNKAQYEVRGQSQKTLSTIFFFCSNVFCLFPFLFSSWIELLTANWLAQIKQTFHEKTYR